MNDDEPRSIPGDLPERFMAALYARDSAAMDACMHRRKESRASCR